jgi:hypothetical protein
MRNTMLNLRSRLIKRVLEGSEFATLEALKKYPSPIGQEAAYNLFIYEFLGDIGTHLEFYFPKEINDELDHMENALKDLQKIVDEKRNDKFTLETFDVSGEEAMNVLAFNNEDRAEIEDVLSVSALEYTINKDYNELIDEIRDSINEIEQESLLARDPYKYYGVNPKDFI